MHSSELSTLLIEMGGAFLGLALLARLSKSLHLSAIPFYLIAGLLLGEGGAIALPFSQNFIKVGAEIGVILLLFTLGLEYTGEQLRESLKRGLFGGVIDFILNFSPGFLVAMWCEWGFVSALVLGGVTYISSSGIIAKMLQDQGRLNTPETPPLISLLVLEDLGMAVFLPILSVVLAGLSFASGILSGAGALSIVILALFVAIRYGNRMSNFIGHHSDEILVLTIFGTVLLLAGIGQVFQLSAPVGAFLVGITISGPIAHHASRVVGPLRDLFAAAFFFFFGLTINPLSLLPVLGAAALLAALTAGTKILTGFMATTSAELNLRTRLWIGLMLIPRGEFSIVIAGLGVAAGAAPTLGPLAAAYVILLAVSGPILVRIIFRKEIRQSQPVTA